MDIDNSLQNYFTFSEPGLKFFGNSQVIRYGWEEGGLPKLGAEAI